MKKIIVLMFVVSAAILSLSGCLDALNPLPTDDECQELISTYLLVHSDFYDADDTINMGDWLGVGVQTRSFDFCHIHEAGIYCGVGYLNSNRIIIYEGE